MKPMKSRLEKGLALQVPALIVTHLVEILVRCTGLFQGEGKLATAFVTHIFVPFIMCWHGNLHQQKL